MDAPTWKAEINVLVLASLALVALGFGAGFNNAFAQGLCQSLVVGLGVAMQIAPKNPPSA